MTAPIQYGRTADGLPPQLLMCGVCDKPATIHKDHEVLDMLDIREFCDRGMEEDFVPAEGLNDYFLHSGNNGVTAYVDFTGNEANVVALLAHSEDEYVVSPDLQEQIENWRDQYPDEHTHALDEWLYCEKKWGNQSFYRESPDAPETVIREDATRSRNVYIEGTGGYHSVQYYDPALTAKYALRLLNVFTNKRGKMQCGGVEIHHNLDGTVTARCVQNTCPSTQFTVSPDSMTREDMEQFVLTVIRHGNNHAAAWFRNRISTFDRKVGQDSYEVLGYDPKLGYNETSLAAVTGSEKIPTFYKIHVSNCAGTLSEPCPTDLHYCPALTDTESVAV